jgi:hypothetical protein
MLLSGPVSGPRKNSTAFTRIACDADISYLDGFRSDWSILYVKTRSPIKYFIPRSTHRCDDLLHPLYKYILTWVNERGLFKSRISHVPVVISVPEDPWISKRDDRSSTFRGLRSVGARSLSSFCNQWLSSDLMVVPQQSPLSTNDK